MTIPTSITAIETIVSEKPELPIQNIGDWEDKHTKIFNQLPQGFANEILNKIVNEKELKDGPEKGTQLVQLFTAEFFEKLVEVEYKAASEVEPSPLATEVLDLLRQNHKFEKGGEWLRRPDLIGIREAEHNSDIEIVEIAEVTLGKLNKRKAAQLQNFASDLTDLLDAARAGHIALDGFPHLQESIGRVKVSKDHTTIVYLSGNKNLGDLWAITDDKAMSKDEWNSFEAYLDGDNLELRSSQFTAQQVHTLSRNILRELSD